MRQRSIILAIGWLLCVVTLAAGQTPRAYLLHIPGIGGHLAIDDMMTGGLREGGLDAEIQIYDWTDGNPGLAALAAYNQNQIQSQKIADLIVAEFHEHPKRKIILTSHSGGGGLAVWALEKLPPEVHVDTLLMLAPALSPNYDLSKAMSHVDGNVYVFSSPFDWIDGWGTQHLGTIDRVYTQAAGNVGFVMPASADKHLYEKLRQFPYDSSWTQFDNLGDHIGTMMRPFAQHVLCPLLKTGNLPIVAPATQPGAGDN